MTAADAHPAAGSGKTYSITGGSERYDERGLIPRALEAIFRAFDEVRAPRAPRGVCGTAHASVQRADRQYVAHVSFLEIYNDVGYDLLDPRHSGSPDDPLQRVSTLTDEDGNVHLRNLSMHPVSSEQDGLRLLYLVRPRGRAASALAPLRRHVTRGAAVHRATQTAPSARRR